MDIVPGRTAGRQIVLVVKYLCAAAAGLFQVLNPTELIKGQGWLVLVWALMILVGGLVAAISAAGDLWIPELAAQPFLIAPFFAWGQAAAAQADGNTTRWAFVCLCAYVICGRLIRSADIWWLAQQSAGSRR